MKRVKHMLMILFFVLGILSLMYGISVMMLASGTKFFLVWYGIAAGFGLLGIFAGGHVWERFPAFLKISFCVLLILTLLGVSVIEAEIIRAGGGEAPENLDYLIVLGAQVKEDGPSFVLKYRLDRAADYLEQNTETRCIVTGGRGYNEPWTEARGMADYLIGEGIDPDRIILEEKAMNTVQNMRFGREFLDPDHDRIGIVTNDFHMFRGMALARKQGMKHVSAIPAKSTMYYKPNNYLREFFGVVKDTLKGNMDLF